MRIPVSYLLSLSLGLLLVFTNPSGDTTTSSSILDTLNLSQIFLLLSTIFSAESPSLPKNDQGVISQEVVNEIQACDSEQISQVNYFGMPDFNMVSIVLAAGMIVALKVYQRVGRIIERDNFEEETYETNDSTEIPAGEIQEHSKFPVNIYFLEDKKQKLGNIPKNAIIIYV